ncbi:MAG: hypothetical protein BA862_07820 [Desulfobulbaceae bacterium S3730MH12]|nr:MAG: hypothetical protein BA866_00910 [Desulfobulbaceae bacterium S5133MH15]OEU56179.1 MAG: hypothetical protein BA862_07820 [Desulfobulbaceae bacterium S3730MH12]OEU82211.1 MAG: hypothetical protein BA873_09610 [Desulfobulbaceae bacterium C00003063]
MNLKETLGSLFSQDELQLLVRGYDVVGDIAIIIIPQELESKEQVIAEVILANNPNIKVVAKRAAQYGGEFRTLPVTIIGGKDRRETEVREFGIRLRLNVEKVYFSIRSGNERRRIASLVQPGENVLVLFSGIAPYPLMISRYSLARRIVGIEKNPVAHDYALLNLKLNKKLNNIELLQGDVRALLPLFSTEFDRVVMVLPKSGEDFLEAALPLLRPGGYLHFYDMQKSDSFAESITKVRSVCEAAKRSLPAADVAVCGHCAPRTCRICVDCLVG